MLLGSIMNCHAQLFFNQNQTIYIGSEVMMSVDGAVVNNGTIENNGEILIESDWENNKQYIAGEGALILVGGDQTINHNGSDIYELVIDGPGDKLFTSDATITGKLFLENGFLTPAADVKVMAAPGAMVSEGYGRSFVNGAFYHQGSGTKIFPIGKNRNYNPVFLSLAGDAVIGFETFEPNPKPYFSFELRDVFQKKYWQQTLVSGSIAEGSSITLPLEWYPDEDVMMEEILIAAADNSGNYRPIPTLETSGFINSGTITAPLNGTFSLYSMALTAANVEERAIYIPNAFAPNHFRARENGEDDRIKVYGKEISEEDFLFRIYNRWGVLVYETTSYLEASTKGWDGINQQTGKAESMGSYKFLLKAKFNSGTPIERSGSIHLIQ